MCTPLNNEISELNLEIDELNNPHQSADNTLPDYSDIESGMSDEDLRNMISNE